MINEIRLIITENIDLVKKGILGFVPTSTMSIYTFLAGLTNYLQFAGLVLSLCIGVYTIIGIKKANKKKDLEIKLLNEKLKNNGSV